MTNKTLIEYIKAAREAGVREYFIRQALSEAGWNKDEVLESLRSEEAWPSKVRVDFIETEERGPVVKKKGGLRVLKKISLPKKFLFVSIFFLVFFGVWGFIKYYDPPYKINLPQLDPQGEISFELGSWSALEDLEFFKEVKAGFLEDKLSFIEGDLSEMKLRVYEDGEVATEVDILSKGREGSWWETPAGLYRVQTKSANHFSSFGGVYMPWSMAFQGNFFIHGWPYYPDGTPVQPGYSGGCIRLSNESAQKVYKLAEAGMPVLVFKKNFSGDDFEYDFPGGQLNVSGFLAADIGNNFVFAEKNSKKLLPIASITKLMTALVATEYINIEREVTINSSALVSTSKPRLQVGQRISVLDLLYPLLMESSNEAGVAIGQILGTDRFVEMMNEKAKAIGMKNTRFTDTTGASHGNVSTAQDLFQLARYLYNNRSFILAISRGDSTTNTAYNPPPWKDLENMNIFFENEDFVGGKVGDNSAAGQTILSVFEVEKAGSKRPVVMIILGSQSREVDAFGLINYIRGAF